MAKLIPSVEKALLSKQKPTEGEIFLIRHLENALEEEVEVYFQPCFNGDRPDVVVLSKGHGVIVIEVKDWDLKNYEVDEKNHWRLRSNGSVLRSPFDQAFQYKKNFFDIHVNGLLEKNLENSNFFSLIKVYVYFHGSSKRDVKALYQDHLDALQESSIQNGIDFKSGAIDHNTYERRRLYIEQRKQKFERDSSTIAVTAENLKKLSLPSNAVLFDDAVYNEFQRLLNPPFHYANEGKTFRYSDKQEKLTQSIAGARVKVCGLAGSGKTVVMAGRAVNAHKRHGGQVLVLTFNITLCSYIHDKISAVRSDFPWSAFQFNNYHKFLSIAFNNCGVEVVIPPGLTYEGTDKKEAREVGKRRDAYLEKTYYSNERVFDEQAVHDKYQTILIDEIQDYRPEWIKIIRDNFLEENGEMVLFGDEHQNIYGRALDGERRSKVVEGFGKWSKLTKSFRYTESSPIIPLAEAFQNAFMKDIYESERDESFQMNLSMTGVWAHANFDDSDTGSMAGQIIAIAKKNKIHPNDISIISSQETVLQGIDLCFRTSEDHKERTLCSFPPIEAKNLAKHWSSYQKIGASRKRGFNLNSGVMKLSSTHSFKGFESPFVFLIVHQGDSPEIVLTGLTRAKESIVVYVQQDSEFFDFFSRRLATVDSAVN